MPLFTECLHQVINVPEAEMDMYFRLLDKRCSEAVDPVWTRTLDLGVLTLKLECRAGFFVPALESHFGYCLRDASGRHDAVFRIWRGDVARYVKDFARGADNISLSCRDGRKMLLRLADKCLSVFDAKTGNLYHCVNALSGDDLAKAGHLFVRQLSKALDTPRSSLVHGAAVGVGDRGVLLCARGGRGKSTLAVSCLLDGCRYVADDYLVLHKPGETLFAHPIYSFITLTEPMRRGLAGLNAEFMYDNYNRSKQVLDISAHHAGFADRLAMRAVVHPVIADVAVPAIHPVPRGKAITQLAHSTMSQMGTVGDNAQTLKLIAMLGDLPGYQIDLSPDVRANARCLREFIAERL